MPSFLNRLTVAQDFAVAPDFAAERLGGGTLRMADLRGKLILLDFWAIWSGAWMGEMPNLKKVHETFGKDPRFALVGLSCNNTAKIAAEYVEASGLTWQQAHVGPVSSSIPTQYAVRNLPARFLIGPDGRVLAKDLKGDDLPKAISAALANDKLFPSGPAPMKPR
jgi:hypothetical protein